MQVYKWIGQPGGLAVAARRRLPPNGHAPPRSPLVETNGSSRCKPVETGSTHQPRAQPAEAGFHLLQPGVFAQLWVTCAAGGQPVSTGLAGCQTAVETAGGRATLEMPDTAGQAPGDD